MKNDSISKLLRKLEGRAEHNLVPRGTHNDAAQESLSPQHYSPGGPSTLQSKDTRELQPNVSQPGDAITDLGNGRHRKDKDIRDMRPVI